MIPPSEILQFAGEASEGWKPELAAAQQLYDEDVRWLAATPQGRRVLGRLLFADCSLVDNASTVSEAGHREVGVEWQRRITRICPETWPLIWMERLQFLQQMEMEE